MSPPSMMRAAVYDAYGPPDVLRVASRPVPKPSPKQILIKVHYASVNPIDVRTRRGELKAFLWGRFPRIPGFDVAGDVVMAAEDSGFAIGDRVFAFLDSVYGGGCAEYAVCSHRVAARVPDRMTFQEAAAVPLAALTAFQSLVELGRLCSGKEVLINGASGGVGGFAVQIAVAYGARVTGVASARNQSFVESLGAESFIDYRERDFTRSGKSWDLIFDAAGKRSFQQCRPVLKTRGRFVSTEPSLGGILTSIATCCLPKRGRVMLVRPSSTGLAELVRLYEAGQFRVFLDQVFPLDAIQDAHRRLEEGVERGKIVVGPL